MTPSVLRNAPSSRLRASDRVSCEAQPLTSITGHAHQHGCLTSPPPCMSASLASWPAKQTSGRHVLSAAATSAPGLDLSAPSQPVNEVEDVRVAAASDTGSAAAGWHPFSQPARWEGTEADALQPGSRVLELAPPWRVMLLSDGSVTRHLQLLTGFSVSVDCLQMQNIGAASEKLPPSARMLRGPLVQRQIFLRLPEQAGPASAGQALVYAASWWQADQVEEYLRDTAAPIWVNLSRERAELYREIQMLQQGDSDFLEQQFGRPGPFWGRQYLFWHNGKPLTVIHEVFSPALEQFLGPMHL